MGWLPWFILLINQLFVFFGGRGTTLLSEKIHIMRQFWEYELGRGGLLQSVTNFQNKTDDPVWVRWKNRWRCASLFPWYTQLRLFPPRTCCGSSSRRNPNWTTWWVLDVSNISNSAWIESIRVSRNQTHINFYQNWKYWVCFIASHISIKEVSSICAFYSCYKKAAPGSVLVSKITKFTKTTFRALAGSRKMEVPPTPTHHTPQPHTTHHAPHTTPPPHPTPHNSLSELTISDFQVRTADSLRESPIKQQIPAKGIYNTWKEYFEKTKIENTAKTEPHQRPPGIFQRIIFCYLWCWCYHSFVLGNQCQLELVACSQLTQKLPANWIIL